ncbi:sugar transferase [Thalassobacillus sp. CUG 92003]|uniref:sugar transferase n=1 Tax=Thalassobacillus sp. CUG 92003 TaxID=2736641 RepID=UPI0015E6C42D|nr:sugar transferase [Thalassobacillus sp. CUG 92003]
MYQKFVKRLLDLVLLIFLMIPLLPIGTIIGLLIKLDSKGSVFFKQKRLGKYGNQFEVFKFRTMVQNAEKLGTGIFTKDEDPRITKIGNILRKTSLDELPQVINVFKGDMSFIGPRPPVPYHPYKYENYNKIQKLRFSVKPGVTGMAQAYGRNTLTWDKRIEYDVIYVENISLFLDIKILLKTIKSIIRKENIYRESGK